MATNSVGRVSQVLGAVVDVQFEGDLPYIQNALTSKIGDRELVLEVAQELGERSVRCISIDSTDGLVRGGEVVDTGAPISVQVAQVLDAVAAGAVAPDVGRVIIDSIKALADVRATEELEARIAALEQKEEG